MDGACAWLMYVLSEKKKINYLDTIYVLRNNIKNVNFFLMKFSIFTAEKYLYIAWACFHQFAQLEA